MGERVSQADELLGAEEVARFLGVELVTIYRWCRQGRLPCLKLGKSWRIRRSALEAFIRQAEQPQTLLAQLGAFLTVPDQILAVAEDAALLIRLDAAVLQVGEASGGLLIKVYDPGVSRRCDLEQQFQQHGLDVARLEASGRFRWCPAADPELGASSLRQCLSEIEDKAQTIWTSVDWAGGIDHAAALRLQVALAPLVAARPLVVVTGVVESTVNTWPTAEEQWRLLGSLRGVIRFGRVGLVLSRVVPPPKG